MWQENAGAENPIHLWQCVLQVVMKLTAKTVCYLTLLALTDFKYLLPEVQ